MKCPFCKHDSTQVIDSLEDLAELDSFPIVLKGGRAIERDGRRLIRRRTTVAADRAELRAARNDPALVPPLIVQPFIRGTGEGLFGLAAAPDDTASWSSHRRVRMVDPQGSGSSACVSTPVDPVLVGAAERFLSSAGWKGLFMLEFLRDAAGQAWFIEMNGRAWGSLALARRLGFEYPAWAVHQAFDPSYRPPSVSLDAGVLCRNLGFELIHLARVVRGPRSKALVDWPSRSKTARAVLRVRRGDRWYNWSRNDPVVFVADAFQSVWGWLRAARST